MKQVETTVIGAGPAGNYFASQQKNSEVHIFEEHKSIGNPVACTGILTDSIKSIIDIPKEVIVSKINTFKIVAPNGKTLYVNLKKTNMVLDRAKFDEHLGQKAQDNGAKFHYNERFIGYKKEENKSGKHIYKIKTNKNNYTTNMIVGADGPASRVARTAGLYGNRKFVKGFQARCKYPGLEEGVTEVHLGLGEFAWVVPEDNKIARVGVIDTNTERLKRDYKKLLGKAKVLQDQSGLIPLYNPKQQFRKKNEDIFLIGDAATQVKATTYGGIIYGLLAGKYLAENKETYEQEFNKKLGKDLWISLKMRDMMNNMQEKQANELIDIFQKKNNLTILQEHDRDFPSKFIVQLLMKEAKLWKLGFDIFSNSLTKKKE